MYLAIALGRRGRPLSPSTIRRVHALLRSALNSAVRRRPIPYSPAEQIELAPENPKRPKPWTAEECHTFLHDIADDRLANLYHLILFTGMRRGEAIGLRWEDLERSAWGPAWNDVGLVFTREDGRPPRPEYATRHFQALAQQSGLPAIRLHDYADVRVMPMFLRTAWSAGVGAWKVSA